MKWKCEHGPPIVAASCLSELQMGRSEICAGLRRIARGVPAELEATRVAAHLRAPAILLDRRRAARAGAEVDVAREAAEGAVGACVDWRRRRAVDDRSGGGGRRQRDPGCIERCGVDGTLARGTARRGRCGIQPRSDAFGAHLVAGGAHAHRISRRVETDDTHLVADYLRCDRLLRAVLADLGLSLSFSRTVHGVSVTKEALASGLVGIPVCECEESARDCELDLPEELLLPPLAAACLHR